MFQGVVAVAGSRSVAGMGLARVAAGSLSLVESGCSLVTGCCVGVDAAAFSSVPVGSVQVLAAFGPGGAGAGPQSAVAEVASFARAGGAVAWWSGGGPSVPLAARLHRRTLAVVRAGQGGLVAFPAASRSAGTWLACCEAARLGRPVVVLPLGVAAAGLPSLGAGRWVPVRGGGVWSGAWRWRSAQAALF